MQDEIIRSQYLFSRLNAAVSSNLSLSISEVSDQRRRLKFRLRSMHAKVFKSVYFEAELLEEDCRHCVVHDSNRCDSANALARCSSSQINKKSLSVAARCTWFIVHYVPYKLTVIFTSKISLNRKLEHTRGFFCPARLSHMTYIE